MSDKDNSKKSSEITRTEIEEKALPGETKDLTKTLERIKLLGEQKTEQSADIDNNPEYQKPIQLTLPGMEQIVRAMPNHVARSSLFAPVARGRRKFHNQTKMVSRSDAILEYTGEQLDEADADIMLQLLHVAKKYPFGSTIPISRHAFLKSMGRSTGKKDYDWLHRRLKSIALSSLYIEVRKKDHSLKYKIGSSEVFHILSSWGYDDRSRTYAFKIDPRWHVLFANKEFALIDWEKRMQIPRGQDMAKALQRLIATSNNNEQRYKLEWLKEKMQYTGPLYKFRISIQAAMDALVRVKVIGQGQILTNKEGEEVTVIRLT